MSDILTEVEKNVRALKRQYRQARAYEDLRKRIDECELDILALERRELENRFETVKGRKDELNRKVNSLRAGMEKTETAQAKMNRAIVENENRLNEIRRIWEDSQSAALRAENALLVLEEKESSAHSQKERTKEDIYRAQQQLEYLAGRHEGLNSEKQHLEAEVEGFKKQWENAKELLNRAIESSRGEKDKLRRLEQNVSIHRKLLNDTERRLDSNEVQIRGLAERKEAVSAERQDIETRLKQLEAHKKDCEDIEKAASSKVKGVEASIDSIINDIAHVEKSLDTVEKRRSKSLIKLERSKSESRFLKSLIEGGEGLRSGVSFLLGKNAPGLVDTVGNLLKVAPEHLKAVSAALGEAAQFIVTENRSAALSAVDALKSESQGRVTIIPLADKFPTINYATFGGESILGTANELVECGERYRKLVDFLLKGVLVVEDLDTANGIIDSGRWEGAVVTLEGEKVEACAVTGGETADGYSTVGGRGRLKELAKEIEQTEENIHEYNAEIDNNRERISTLKTRHQELNAELNGLKSDIDNTARRSASLSGEISTLRLRIESDEKEMSALEEKINGMRDEIAALKDSHISASKALSESESELEEARRIFQEAGDSLSLRREESHRRELTLSDKSGKLDKLKSEISLGKLRQQELKEEISRFSRNIIDIDRRLEQMSVDKVKVGKAIAENNKHCDELKTELGEYETQLTRLKEERAALEKTLRNRKSEADELKDDLSAEKVTSAEIESKISALDDTALDKFGIELKSVESLPSENREKISAELEKLKRKITAFGPVNLLALQEYGKAKERLDFLQSELEDIVKSKETLYETISKTNAEARIKFRKAFDEVKNNFKLLFADLFDGGNGEIYLDSGDPLEAKIYMRADPAGKKLATLDQLSGGEKALTALALIFALYQLKPSPFCILDEVDAPLDDANVERFIKLLRRFISQTQFILVTHNKRTMEASDYLYGVTMEEEGVSKLVSVRLADQLEKVNGKR